MMTRTLAARAPRRACGALILAAALATAACSSDDDATSDSTNAGSPAGTTAPTITETDASMDPATTSAPSSTAPADVEAEGRDAVASAVDRLAGFPALRHDVTFDGAQPTTLRITALRSGLVHASGTIGTEPLALLQLDGLVFVRTSESTWRRLGAAPWITAELDPAVALVRGRSFGLDARRLAPRSMAASLRDALGNEPDVEWVPGEEPMFRDAGGLGRRHRVRPRTGRRHQHRAGRDA